MSDHDPLLWVHPQDWDMLSNALKGEPQAYRLTAGDFEPVVPVALPQADGAGE